MSGRTKEENLLLTKIKVIETEIKKADKAIKASKQSEEEIQKQTSKLTTLIDGLRGIANQYPDAASAIKFDAQIAALKRQVRRPNISQQPIYHVQQEARAAAAEVVLRWGDVNPGVSLNVLAAVPATKQRLMACTTEDWSPFQVVLHNMIDRRRLMETSKVTTARCNFATALFQAMVPQFCGMNIPEEAAVMGNVNSVRDLLECIAIVACNKSEENYNPLAVFGEAAFLDPVQFVKDVLGIGFALGTLIEMAGPTATKLASEMPSVASEVVKYVAGNPLTSFTTYQVTFPYVQSLLQKVFGDRFGVQDQWDNDMRRLFDELSAHYMRQGVTDIIGFPPADIDSVRNRLNQILYQIGYRTIASLQSTAGIVEAAKRFPAELCQRVMSAGTAINRWLCDNGMRLLERYKFIPQGTEEGLFERILRELDRKGLRENPHIDAFVIAYLKHNQPTTVFHESVEYFMAEQVMKYGPLLPPGEITESAQAFASSDVGSEFEDDYEEQSGFGQILGDREIPAGRQFVPNLSNQVNFPDFKFEQQNRQLAAAAAAAAVQGGDGYPPPDRVLSFDRTGANLSPASGGLPRAFGGPGGSAFGGRSRSRKRSVSKRTRRNGVAKKQKSNKIKRQSRRKVRRASSRKGRK